MRGLVDVSGDRNLRGTVTRFACWALKGIKADFFTVEVIMVRQKRVVWGSVIIRK